MQSRSERVLIKINFRASCRKAGLTWVNVKFLSKLSSGLLIVLRDISLEILSGSIVVLVCKVLK